MKGLKFLTFLSVLGGIFLIINYNSHHRGFYGICKSFKMAVLVATIISGLISYPVGAEEIEYYFPNNSSAMEKVLLSNQEFNSLDDKNLQVILAKSKVNPIVLPSGPSNFPTPLSGGRPSRPVTTPYVNPFSYLTITLYLTSIRITIEKFFKTKLNVAKISILR